MPPAWWVLSIFILFIWSKFQRGPRWEYMVMLADISADPERRRAAIEDNMQVAGFSRWEFVGIVTPPSTGIASLVFKRRYV